MRIGLITLMPSLNLPMGDSTVELVGGKMSVDVVFDYRPAMPDSDAGPGDDAMVKIESILLRASLALHDTNNVMTLIISAGTDVLILLPERVVERIGEQVLQEVEKE